MGRRTRRADDVANHLNDFAPVLSRAVDLASPKILRSSLSRRARSDPYPRPISRPDRSSPIGPNHTVPTGRFAFFARIPGNELPGLRRAQSSRYDHSVPPGRISHGPIPGNPAATGFLPTILLSLRDKVPQTPYPTQTAAKSARRTITR